ncbi:hypothetical protein SDC9_172568 [bioreactor metagenome]|uniref:Uncharacterized protein n=1 Tax=bioreactor metagenome TaxID=1076179 RepID=A0A645GE16_9ZZZZ
MQTLEASEFLCPLDFCAYANGGIPFKKRIVYRTQLLDR